MKLVIRKQLTLIFVLLLGFPAIGLSQEYTPYELTLSRAIELAMQNHQQLKIAEARVDAGEQQVKVSKSQMLPSVTFSANAFYLGDALVLDTDWSKLQTVDMPHFGNTFGLQASQLLYKGGLLRKSVEVAELQRQLAELDLETNEQDVKFLIVSNYLDIYKMINQIKVLEQNKVLAEQLLANITKMQEQEMVTKNELIRSELQIKNIEQSILSLNNGYAIMSNRMSYALGLPEDILIVPVDDIKSDITLMPRDYYKDAARENHPALKSADKNVEIAEKAVGIARSDWFPAISAFGGYNMQRPVTTSTPVMDLYNNSWQAGVTLSFNIDNLYKTKNKVNHSKSQARITKEALTYTQQNIDTGVNAAFLQYREAEQQVVLMGESRKLADENYELVRAKYLNQLAITAEMTDASNAKLNAELQYANAVMNAMFQYYNLLKSTGTL